MRRYFSFLSHFLLFGLLISTAILRSATAADVSLATSPLASSTTTAVKPNLLLVLDNSGSMDWDHMPDDSSDGGSSVTFIYGYYGLRSSQCNQVYYDPATTYFPPVDATGTSYPNATFSSAWTNGFNTGSGTVNLNTSFKASQSLNGDSLGQSAYYYNYSGTQLSQLQQNYNVPTNAFNLECKDSTGSSTSSIAPANGVKALVGGAPTTPGSGVFTKERLATTETTTIVVSGSSSTSVTGITVNGIQLMSGSSTASATSNSVATNIVTKLNLNGFSATVPSNSSTITVTGPTSATNYAPVITCSVSPCPMTFTTDIFPDTTAAKLTNFANWYSYYRTRLLMMKTATGRAFSSLDNGFRVGLMKISSSSTPTVGVGTFENTQRSDWYTALYNTSTSGSTPLRTALSDAGRYYAGKLSGTDPVQYSCQQNFSILSTDGYWNAGNGYQVDGSTAVGNQDGSADRAMYDGAQSTSQWTFSYNRNTYSKVTDTCTGGKKKLSTQAQVGSCTKTVSTGSCSPSNWTNNGSAILDSNCTNTSAPSSSAAVLVGSPVPSLAISGGSSDSLSDVAMYYYQTDLRTPALNNCGTPISPATVGPLCDNNVFTSTTDNNLQQHMTTFTLGLGASGWMNYSSSYLRDSTGDYAAVKLGSTASSTVCTWQTAGTVCNWPMPGMTGSDGLIANIDDLWHAAINGRGAYFSATSPMSLSAGLANALNGIKSRKGAAAAAATSTQNPIPGNNAAFYASYTTVEWKGNLEKREINTDTGVFNKDASWCAEDIAASSCATTPVAQASGNTTIYNCETPSSVICSGGVIGFSGNLTSGPTYCKVPVATACTGTMDALVSTTSDTRTIKTPNSAGTALINFDTAFAAANPSYFNAAHISTLSQWTTLTTAQQSNAQGANLLNYLRGQYDYEDRSVNDGTDKKLYRYRSTVLGDVLDSQPNFVGKPIFSYPYPGYSNFQTTQASRAGAVYVGANDGMLHAFADDTGLERWAYVPSMVIPNMWKLADFNYANSHVNFINGSTVVSDICSANCTNSTTAVWKTILIGGLNGGGRGYYALDITNPTTPSLLWEFTTTAGIGSTKDADIGYSFGNPLITRKADGTWVVVVTSGYNNDVTGNGQGYLYVLNANTGSIVSKIATGVGTTTTPSGLSKISGFNVEPTGNTVSYIYGGDLQGNLWRFDINDTTTTATIGSGSVLKLAKLYWDSTVSSDSSVATTKDQPITTSPILGKISGKRVVFIGTGKYLETGDLTNTDLQSQYAIKDDNATTTLINPRRTLVQQTLSLNPNNTATRLASSNVVNFYTGNGWYVDFNLTSEAGERVNIDADLVQGVLIVPTIVPSNTACSPGGHGWLNFFDYRTGGALDSSGLASFKYDSPIVGGNLLYIDGKPVYPLITADGNLQDPPPIPFPSSAGSFTGKRTLWRELQNQN